MAFLRLKTKFAKSGDIKLLSAIKLDEQGSDYFYFRPKDQFLCLHVSKFHNPPDFKKYHQKRLNLNGSDIPKYYDFHQRKFKFNDKWLLTEAEYNNLIQ